MSVCARAAFLSAAGVAAPRAAAACATCISSGFGDQSYSWPYIGLIVMPFLVAAAIVAVLAWSAGWQPQQARERLSSWSARRRQRPARAPLSPRTNTETT
jgi:hypothetical protein